MKPVIGLSMSFDPTNDRLYLKQTYATSILEAGGIPFLIPYLDDMETMQQIATHCDGLLLTGGGDIDPNYYHEEPIPEQGEVVPARDVTELQLVKAFRNQNKPIFGICRGHQLLNVALGGTLYQDILAQGAAKLQHVQVAPREHLSHRVQVAAGSLLHSIVKQEEIKVNSFHHQAVKKIAPSLVVSGMSRDGVIEAIESRSEPFLLGVQWHPEDLAEKQETAKVLFTTFVNACRVSLSRTSR